MSISLNRKCPHCAQQMAVVTGENSNTPEVYALLKLEMDNGEYKLHIKERNSFLSLCSLMCLNCGHIEFISERYLAALSEAGKQA